MTRLQHPTAYTRDNLAGFLSIVQLAPPDRSALAEGDVPGDYLLAWIPEMAIQGTPDWDQYILVELGEGGRGVEGALVAPPAPPSAHGFSVPLAALYSVVLQPPTLSAWYGSVTFNLFNTQDGGGPTAMPALFFHDEESRSTVLDRDQRVAQLGVSSSGQTRRVGAGAGTPPPVDDASLGARPLPPGWGGESLLSALRQYANLLRSRLEPKLFLVNPSKIDREVHETELFEDDVVPSRKGDPGRESTKRTSILHKSLPKTGGGSGSGGDGDDWPDEVPAAQMDNLTFSVLNGFSRFSRGARAAVQTATSTAQQTAKLALNHPMAKPIAKYVPTPVAQFANAAPGEIAKAVEVSGVDEYSSARVYLAKWARVVAEEGERARKAEVVFHGPGGRQEDSEVGAFEVLATTYSITRPISTRAHNQPIYGSEWAAWFADDGRLMIDVVEAKKRIFQRGLADDARKDVWPFLLGIYGWDSSTLERAQRRRQLSDDYYRLKAGWANDDVLHKTDRFAEESHRVQIDCLRTDRTHPMFAWAETDPAPENAHPRSNPHVMATQAILMTYVFAEKDRDGYVQGMSDLLSPIYVVLDGEEELAFAGFGTVMERMKGNFLADQSGMMRQLTDLQGLVRKMDFQLFTHLDQTGSLNLFFTYRWILTGFKRELSFPQTLRLWEVLFTDHYSSHFHLFVALAIIEANRDVIIRYLKEFDEVLKFFNELSGTLDVEAVLADAEVLFIAFAKMVDVADRRAAEAKAAGGQARAGGEGEGLRRRNVGNGEKEKEEGEGGKEVVEAEEDKPLPPVVGEGEGRVVELEGPEGLRKGEVPEIEDNLRELLR